MGDVIEACADGGFDIPATPVDTRPARPIIYPSKTSEKENASEKPRRVTIQFADDGDDSGNDYRVVDEKRAGDRHPATATQKTFAPSVTTSQHLTEDRRKRLDEESSDARAGEDAPAAAAAVTAGVEPPAASDGVSAVDDAPELHRPEYRIYKIETPDEENPSLEIVIALSGASAEGCEKNAETAPVDKSTSLPPENPRRGKPGCNKEHPRPSVTLLPDGRGVVVDPHGASKGCGGSDADRRLQLTFPKRVVPESAKIFFWEGDITIRAVLAAEG